MRMSYSIIVKIVAYNKLEAAVTLFFSHEMSHFQIPFTLYDSSRFNSSVNKSPLAENVTEPNIPAVCT